MPASSFRSPWVCFSRSTSIADYAVAGVPLSTFALFTGIAMSVTAFPVLARIIAERGLTGTELGNLAIGCAAIDDVTAWCLLALVLAIGRGSGFVEPVRWRCRSRLEWRWSPSPSCAPVPSGFSGTQRRWLRPQACSSPCCSSRLPLRWRRRPSVSTRCLARSSPGSRSLVPRGCASRSVTRSSRSPAPCCCRCSSRTRDCERRSGSCRGDAWLACGLIIAAAVAGKFGAIALAARFQGLRWSDSLALGALMNTRGLMELIVLNIGYDLGILSPAMYTMMIVMALVTTCMAGPALGAMARRTAIGELVSS